MLQAGQLLGIYVHELTRVLALVPSHCLTDTRWALQPHATDSSMHRRTTQTEDDCNPIWSPATLRAQLGNRLLMLDRQAAR
jgi:hypothetical protein